MHIGQLIHTLKHGHGYNLNNEDGTITRVLQPPTKYTLRAAEILQKAIEDNEYLINQVVKLQESLANAEAQIQHLSRLSQHGPASGPGSSNGSPSQGQNDAGIDGPAGA